MSVQMFQLYAEKCSLSIEDLIEYGK